MLTKLIINVKNRKIYVFQNSQKWATESSNLVVKCVTQTRNMTLLVILTCSVYCLPFRSDPLAVEARPLYRAEGSQKTRRTHGPNLQEEINSHF